MGTNYYLLKDVCKHCGRGDDKIHLGKCSSGWAFTFRGYRENDPNNGIDGVKVECIEDWLNLIRHTPNSKIVDEYGREENQEDFITSAVYHGFNYEKRTGRKALQHAEYSHNQKDPMFRRHALETDEMIGGHSFTFVEFS